MFLWQDHFTIRTDRDLHPWWRIEHKETGAVVKDRPGCFEAIMWARSWGEGKLEALENKAGGA